MRIRYAGITDSCTDGLEFSPAICIFFQGCDIHCDGCYNQELWDERKGTEADTHEIILMLNKYRDFYKGVVFLGGEPTLQEDALYEIASNVTLPKVLYTGHTIEELSDRLISLFDIIVDGAYYKGLATGSFPASANQIIWKRSDDGARFDRKTI